MKNHRRALKRTIVGASAIALAAGALAALPANAQEKVFRIGASTEVANRGNVFKGASTPSIYVWHAVFDSLTFVNKDGELEPRAALSWESKDPNTWVFKLRPGMKFSNGETFSANSVVQAIDYLRNDELGKTMYVARESGANNIVEAVALDANTVQFKTAAPEVLLPSRMSMFWTVPEKYFKDAGIETFTQKPVGTGAFTVESWEPTTVMKARSDAWRTPKIDRIDYITLNERAARVQALLSDQVDIAISLSFDDIDAVKNGGKEVHVVPIGSTMALALPNQVHADSPLNDKRVRQAFNYATNRQLIAEEIGRGMVKAASQPGTPVAYGYNANLDPYPYDPAKAKQLLTEAGYGDGFKVKFGVVTGAFPGDSEAYQLIAQDLSKVGVELELEKITFSKWLPNYFQNKWWEDGQYHGFSLTMNSVPYLDATRSMSYYSCQKNNPFFCDEDVVKLLEEQAAEFNPDERLKKLHHLAEVYQDVAPALYIFERISITGIGPRVVGFENENEAFNVTSLDLN